MRPLGFVISCSALALTVVLQGCGGGGGSGSKQCTISNCKNMSSTEEPCTCTACTSDQYALSADNKSCEDCRQTIKNCVDVHIPPGVSTCSNSKVTCKQCKAGPVVRSADKRTCEDCNHTILDCEELIIPPGVTTCNDTRVTCKQCKPNAFYDSDKRKCVVCSRAIAHCKSLVFNGATSCNDTRITCGQCDDGAFPTEANRKCHECRMNETNLWNCSAVHIPPGVTRCDDQRVSCGECAKGFVKDLTDDTQCWQQDTCTPGQHSAGCAPFSCSSARKHRINVDNVYFMDMERVLREEAAKVDATSGCTCVPGTQASGGSCQPMKSPASMRFYAYRAVDDNHYNHGLDNTNAANLAGNLYYVAKSVLRGQSCPRLHQITKIVRYEVEVKNTQENFALRSGQFGHMEAFTRGTVVDKDQALQRFKQYGYTVGCQAVTQANYTDSAWYSFPGVCPNSTGKVGNCTRDYPGGMCGPDVDPVGNSTCTWNAKFKGEVTLDKISGIDNHAAFCNSKFLEYDPHTDKGSGGVTFWDDIDNRSRNLDRVRKVLRLFKEAYPNATEYPEYPDPLCDGW